MYSNLPPLPYRDSVKCWNKTAIDCYLINCDCSKCFIYKTFFEGTKDDCKMKYYVEYNLQKLGKPLFPNLQRN